MNSLSDLISSRKPVEEVVSKKKRGITNKRQWLLKQFQDEINFERMGTKWKPITGRVIAMKVTHLDVSSLEYFLSICKDYKNRKGSFSKCFFGGLKVEDKK